MRIEKHYSNLHPVSPVIDGRSAISQTLYRNLPLDSTNDQLPIQYTLSEEIGSCKLRKQRMFKGEFRGQNACHPRLRPGRYAQT